MALDRTKTIKQRRIDVYLPTLQAKAAWLREAGKRRMSVSEMVFQIVQPAIGEAYEDHEKRARDFEEQVADLTAQIADLQGRIRQLEIVNERAEHDLEAYRAQAFTGTSPLKKLDPRLFKMFTEARGRDGRLRPVTEQELRKVLRLQPSDVARAKALNAQLEFLESHGLLVKGPRGWVWNG